MEVQYLFHPISSAFAPTNHCFWWTNFCHKRRNPLGWRPPLPSQDWVRIGHPAIGQQWRWSDEDRQTFLSTPVDSDDAVVPVSFVCTYSVVALMQKPSVAHLDHNHPNESRRSFIYMLWSNAHAQDHSEHWEKIRGALHSAKGAK